MEHVWHLHSAGISKLKLRFDCLNLFYEVVQLRDGSGLGIAARLRTAPGVLCRDHRRLLKMNRAVSRQSALLSTALRAKTFDLQKMALHGRLEMPSDVF